MKSLLINEQPLDLRGDLRLDFALYFQALLRL